ncbi:hypothetical protein GGTG_06919 [Gaeumannomyces tritici R3-111a-1]|uniref:Uncharacterized protein n=1 Tax=Gaeumannomyces tritici (strain R3-111a-1) TaxID=644352 RepID=J3P072_GAET3|nr:hypothetical protein GGTG_06919 [Gaeumannomyces tritici R3-111a-1]EJT77005.1 hypothetical protein GGTG_06919 [Gaeumannomyces tritici R3-111a-1]
MSNYGNANKHSLVFKQTPERFKENKRLGHTIRLVRLLDLSGPGKKRRRLDDARYETNIPGQVQEPPHKWLLSYVGRDTSQEFISDLAGDGFGFVLKIPREMKTTWKLFWTRWRPFSRRWQVHADPVADQLFSNIREFTYRRTEVEAAMN